MRDGRPTVPGGGEGARAEWAGSPSGCLWWGGAVERGRQPPCRFSFLFCQFCVDRGALTALPTRSTATPSTRRPPRPSASPIAWRPQAMVSPARPATAEPHTPGDGACGLLRPGPDEPNQPPRPQWTSGSRCSRRPPRLALTAARLGAPALPHPPPPRPRYETQDLKKGFPLPPTAPPPRWYPHQVAAPPTPYSRSAAVAAASGGEKGVRAPLQPHRVRTARARGLPT